MPMKARYTVVEGEVIAQKRNGVRHLLVPDAQGSTVALVGSSSTITDTFEYWPYGEVRTRTGTTRMPFQYIGALGYYRDSSGRTYVRARVLRTDLGTWMTVDPLWPSQVPYGYANGSPTSRSDPSGLDPCSRFNTGPKWKYTTPCGTLSVPGGLKPLPPFSGQSEQWACFHHLLVQEMGTIGAAACLARNGLALTQYLLLLHMGELDKFVHCLVGCHIGAGKGGDKCCAYYMAVWLEVRPSPNAGKPSQLDFWATLYGYTNCLASRCEPDRELDCRACCANGLNRGDIWLDPDQHWQIRPSSRS